MRRRGPKKNEWWGKQKRFPDGTFGPKFKPKQFKIKKAK